MPDTLIPNYTKEELDAAKDELSKMKPEDLLLLNTELGLARDAVTLGEAPAIAFMELRAASGAKINLTVRATSGPSVLDALAIAVAYARDRYAIQTVGQPTSSAPLPMAEQPVAPPMTAPPDADAVGVTLIPAQPPMIYSTSAQMPTTPQVATTEISVQSIIRERKQDGKGDFLRVRGGKYTRFGVPAYPEYIPKGLDMNQMQYGLEYTAIPEVMRFALVTDTKPNRVISFHS